MHKKTAVIIGLIFVLVSCASDNDAVRIIPEYNESLIRRLNGMLSQGEYESVIQLCDQIEDSRVHEIETAAVEGLRSRFDTERKSGNFRAAAESLKSLTAAGAESDVSTVELYLDEVMKHLADDEVTLALAVFQNRIINSGDEIEISPENIDEIVAAAEGNRNKAVLGYMLKRYPDHGFMDPDGIKKILEYIPEKEDLISGTVTIWVDRGIRLERGIGYPDRVIGSGFYIDKRGYVLTNYHVISSEVDPEYEGFSRLYIKFSDTEERIPAEVVGWDASLDIALLKVLLTPDYIYSFPENRDYRPGEKIYAIGSPGGLDKTITSGIISASGNRRLLPIGDTMQVDVPINAGNSGGPLIDDKGNLVGVVFAGIEQFEGVNFVIPADWIINSLPELYTPGRNVQSWLGLTVHEGKDGLEIMYVMPGTSAFRTSLKTGDKIISIDGLPVSEITECQAIVQRKRPGTLLKFEVERNGEKNNMLLQVENREDLPMEKALELDSRKNLLSPFLGMVVDKASDDILGQEYVIRKVYRGSPADETGLSADDPFSIVTWEIDETNNILMVGIRIKKRKAGFLETVIQLGNYIDLNNTI